MSQLYHNTALIWLFGKPYLLITCICDAKGKETTYALLFRRVAKDYLDLLSRVFTMKLDELLKNI